MPLRTLRHPGGWCIVPIHYSMDTDKDTAWVVNERRKYPLQSDWDREMECDMRSVAGNPAYPHWSDPIHIKDDIGLLPSLPLCLACDFNVNPMVWMVSQIFRRQVLVLDEVVGKGLSVPQLVTEFRNRYPTHTAELWVYGDAAGNSRNAQTAMSDYDLMKIGLQGYAPPIVWKIPGYNPPVKERLAAVNNHLRDADGRAWVKVHPRCRYIIEDMQEVVLDANGGIKKTTDPSEPYSQRTHGSDALGYLIHREFPVYVAAMNTQPRSRRPQRVYGRLLGEV